MANLNIVWIDPDVCEKCNICVEAFGCPAIQKGTGGGVPWIHAELCNGNGSCIQVCPLQAIKRPNQARFGAKAEPTDLATGARSGELSSPQGQVAEQSEAKDQSEGYSGGPTRGTKTDFAGPGSEKCK